MSLTVIFESFLTALTGFLTSTAVDILGQSVQCLLLSTDVFFSGQSKLLYWLCPMFVQYPCSIFPVHLNFKMVCLSPIEIALVIMIAEQQIPFSQV